jgi:hypothetical protein
MRLKRSLVSALDSACGVVDGVAYRPAVVRATMFLPRWWRCKLARLSVRLDERWDTGYWGKDQAGAPAGVCDASNRRAAWLVISGRDWMEDIPPDGSYMEEHPVHVCGWCQLPKGPIENDQQLADALARARERSISWRWSRRVL